MKALGDRLKRDETIYIGSGPSVFTPWSMNEESDEEVAAWTRQIVEAMEQKQEKHMHYRNGREAKNGDRLIQIGSDGQVTTLGVLYSAKPGDDYCNGYIAPIQSVAATACLIDCLHLDDVAAMLKEKGFDKRPAGK